MVQNLCNFPHRLDRPGMSTLRESLHYPYQDPSNNLPWALLSLQVDIEINFIEFSGKKSYDLTMLSTYERKISDQIHFLTF